MSKSLSNMSGESSRENPQASEIRYRMLFETARDGIIVLDALTRKIIDVNPSMIELLGCSRTDVLGRELDEIGLFRDSDESGEVFRELLEKEYLHCADTRLETRAGTVFEIEFTANVYSEETRRVIQCNIRDITDRFRAREVRDLIALNAVKMMEIAGRVARLGGWTISLPERILTWSDENCAIHEVPPGYQPTLEEGIGYYPPEYQEQVRGYVNACAQDGMPYDFELPKYTAKGRLIWVRSIGEAMRDEEGVIIGIQGAFQDITIRRQVEAEREKLIEELRNALAEVRTLREFLPICSYCKKIRDDDNYWSQIESYISMHTPTKFTHSICPDCYETEVTPQLEKLRQKKSNDFQA